MTLMSFHILRRNITKYNFVIENIAVKSIKFKGFTAPSGGAVLVCKGNYFFTSGWTCNGFMALYHKNRNKEFVYNWYDYDHLISMFGNAILNYIKEKDVY